MSGYLFLAASTGLTLWCTVVWLGRRSGRRSGEDRVRFAARLRELRGELEAASDDPASADPLDELEAELDHLRRLVARVRARQADRAGGPALAN